MRFVFVDAEYYNTAEAQLSVVCMAAMVRDNAVNQPPIATWLYDSPEAQEAFRQFVAQEKANGSVFVSYNAIAEGRAFLSLGIDPTALVWVDLMLEWKQLRNGNDKRLYGPYVNKKGLPKKSYPPLRDDFGRVIDKSELPAHQRKDNSQTPHNLVSCIYNITGKLISAEHKTRMRDRILAGGPYNEKDAKEILAYCTDDIVYLPEVLLTCDKEIRRMAKVSREQYFQYAYIRGEWAVRLAKIEAEGLPVNVQRLQRIAENYEAIHSTAIKHLVENYFPFYVQEKRKGEMVWVDKEAKFAEYIAGRGMAEHWPLSKAKRLKRDKETLKNNEHLPEILEYRRTRETLNQIKSFRAGTAGTTWESVGAFEDEESSPSTEGKENIFHRIGSDRRLRSYFNPMGTQTSRNAPPATNFILAMSSWIRSCMEAPPGMAITSLDFKSQEVLIAAIMSKDKNLLDAYSSGDVYLAFAKQAGVIPKDGTKKTHKAERDASKSVVLGMQFGMGRNKLHLKLMADTKDPTYFRDKSDGLYDNHKDIYSTYWDWSENLISGYVNNTPLKTQDGWYLFCDNPNSRSVGNFPVQGGGAAVLRRAVRYCHEKNLKVVATLHDAIYCVHPIKDAATVTETMRECMTRAFRDVIGGEVLLDAKTVPHGTFYLEDKGFERFMALKEYFLNDAELDQIFLQYGR